MFILRDYCRPRCSCEYCANLIQNKNNLDTSELFSIVTEQPNSPALKLPKYFLALKVQSTLRSTYCIYRSPSAISTLKYKPIFSEVYLSEWGWGLDAKSIIIPLQVQSVQFSDMKHKLCFHRLIIEY